MTATSLPVGPAGPAALPAHGPSRTQRFLMLMRREWLQHRVGWTVLLAAPTALMMLLTVLDHSLVQIQLDERDGIVANLQTAPAVLQVMLLGLAVPLITVLLTLLTVGFQLPGLARRDVQDRSIEFWRSLPTSHAQSLGAPLLMHLLVLPWAALAAGVAGAWIVGLGMVSVTHGIGAWLTLSWPTLVAAELAMALRAAWGLLLAMLWLSPLAMLTLAASAWLKRWGVPVLAAAVLAGLNLLDPRLPAPWLKLSLERLRVEALQALMTQSPLKGAHIAAPADIVDWLPDLPGWALRDAGAALAHLASPAFVAALAVAAAGFALLLWRRRVH